MLTRDPITMKFPADFRELYRRLKRNISWSYRRIFICLVIFTILFLYSGPKIVRWVLGPTTQSSEEPWNRCMDERLSPFYHPALEFDVNIRHNPPFPHERNILPFVGNGYFGTEVNRDANVYIKGKRGLQIPINFHPIVSVKTKGEPEDTQEATVVDYQSGIAHRFQCNGDEFFAAYQYYAHRNMPHVFVQEVKVTNLKKLILDVDLISPRISDWPTAVTQTVKLQHGSTIVEYSAVTGAIELTDSPDLVVIVSIVYRDLQRTLTLKKRGTTTLELLTTIVYSDPVSRAVFQAATLKNQIEKKAIAAMEKALQDAVHESRDYYEFRRQHVKAWNSLWATGFHISTSKADNSLNGDRLNSTIYAVLSHVRAYEFEESITPQKKEEIGNALTYSEGCYESYHTLEAENLWREMSTMEAMNDVVKSWLLTLEKHGCHNLIKAGASGVVQAMVLSFGSFRFTNQHLEFRIHPKYLHRDYSFRRLNYGDMTHVNVTVEVTEDNKAVIYVALDRSDTHYYACDAGCLDEPVQLGQSRQMFPVKLTEPLTAILYITSDRQHIEELHHAIHVKEVIEAPALEHHIVALHKHGHRLGGLPVLFWVSIIAIIIIFHIFLCKLIAKEYFNPPDKMRYRYSKP